jgi:hydroxymethylpyrimidine/phosphomethylpyrimidine kinase
MNLSQMRKRDLHRVRRLSLLAIGGLDPGAGAGLGRDLLTGRAFGAAVRLVATAFTEQSADRVLSVEPRDPGALDVAVKQALRTHTPDAVKIGMTPGSEHAAAILRALEGFAGPVIADPVLRASSGGALWAGPASGLLPLLRRATVATPNIPEAEALTGQAIRTLDEAAAAAAALCAAGVRAVFLKGGHLPAAAAAAEDAGVTDILLADGHERRLSRPRIAGASPRGTGCALATALAVHLGEGLPLEEAAARAADWLADQIANAIDLGGERQLS